MPTISGLRRRGLHAGGDPRVRRADRRRQAREPRRRRAARGRDPGRPEQARAARDGRAAAAEGRHRELPGGPGRGDRAAAQPGSARGRHAPHVRSRASSTSSATTSWRTPPKKFFRLSPGREVRLRGTYFLTCERAVKNASGEVVELRCTYDPATRDGNAPDGRKPKATIHWVSAAHAITAEVRLYDRLFTSLTPGGEDDGGDWRTSLNPASLETLTCPRRAHAGRREAWRSLPVRAPRLLLRRSGLDGGAARVQPDRHAQGHLGAGRRAGQ